MALCIVCIAMMQPAFAEERNTTLILSNSSILKKMVYPEPGGIVYYGEVADIWNFIGWADEYGNYALDYFFYGHDCSDRNPDLVVDITKPKAVEITTSKFKYDGIYYQHMLAGERDCIPVIEVRTGTRRENVSDEIIAQSNRTTPVVYDPWPELPPKKADYDILIPRYQPVNLTNISSTGWYWMFHIAKDVSILQTPIQSLEPSSSLLPGMYRIYIQEPGNNSVIGTFYYPEEDRVRCAADKPLKEKPTGAAYVYERDLVSALGNPLCSDDVWYNLTAEVEEPSVMFADMFENSDTVLVNGSHILYVQGYTNLQAGTELELSIDKYRWLGHNDIRPHTFKTSVISSSTGYYNWFRAKVLYDPDDLILGNNTLTVTTPYGSETSIDLKVNAMPEGMTPPPFYQKYFNNTEWYPTPTPETITIRDTVYETVINETSVMVEVPPSDEQVYEAQKKVVYGMLCDVVWFGINCVVGLATAAVLYVVARFILVVVRHAKK